MISIRTNVFIEARVTSFDDELTPAAPLGALPSSLGTAGRLRPRPRARPRSLMYVCICIYLELIQS